MEYDIVVLTDCRYAVSKTDKPLVANILLEDQLVVDALEEQGLRVIRKSWDDASFDWSSTKFAMFRSTWDYIHRYKEFSEWYQKAGQATNFINSKNLIAWNIDKHYLQELNAKGINIPNTYFIEPDKNITLAGVIQKADEAFGNPCKEFVLKPCISGGARHTYKFHRKDWKEHNAIFKKLIAEESMMLQEFQYHIVDEGEVSLMVFNGQYTHAVLKIAKKGDFRVQDDYGGSVHEYKASKEQIEFAKQVVLASPEMPMYARVDIFRDNSGNWALAELEIFEPELWFRLEPEAAHVMAKAIKQNFF